MYNSTQAKELAQLALEEARRSAASYAEVRYESIWSETVMIRDHQLHVAETKFDRGIGVRVLVGGAWGFAAVSEPNHHDIRVVVRKAVELARIAAILQDVPVELVGIEAQNGVYRTKLGRDPMGVPLEDKCALLEDIQRTLAEVPLVVNSSVLFQAERRQKLFLSTENTELEQDLTYCGVQLEAIASNGEERQVRTTSPGASGVVLGGGWDVIESLDLNEHARSLGEQAAELLNAEPCPHESMPVILSPDILTTHINGSLAHYLELDRLMGLGASDVQRVVLGVDDLDGFQLGSSHINLASDTQYLGGAGTYGYDDEGVPSERIELLSEGQVVGYLSGRESAARLGLERSQGAMRAESWASPPYTRAANLLLEPGRNGDLEALISDTSRGVLLEGMQSLSVDEYGQTFVGVAEQGWLINQGRRTQLVKNPCYRGSTLSFWQSCDGVAGASDWKLSGVRTHPMGPSTAVGVGAAPARFSDIEVGRLPPEVIRPDHNMGLPMVLLSSKDAMRRSAESRSSQKDAL